MNRSGQNWKSNFISPSAKSWRQKLILLGLVTAPRVHEINLRFDTPDLSLIRMGKLLRLRKDTRARVTL